MKVRNENEVFRDIRDTIDELAKDNEQTVYFIDGFEGGLIGYSWDSDSNIHAVYDYDKCADFYIRQNECTHEDFVDWWEFNTLRSLPYIEESGRPIIINTI